MIVGGLLFALVGWITGLSILVTLGVIIAVIGLVMLVVRPGGRRYY